MPSILPPPWARISQAALFPAAPTPAGARSRHERLRAHAHRLDPICRSSRVVLASRRPDVGPDRASIAIVAFAMRGSRATGCTPVYAPGPASAVVVASFGDGEVESAKHAHFAPRRAVSNLGVPLASTKPRGVRARATRHPIGKAHA